MAKTKLSKLHAGKTQVRKTRPRRPATRAQSARKPVRRSAEDMLKELKHRLLEISDLASADSVLGWNQATYMPPGGAAARGRQGAALRKFAHEKSVDPELGRLLDTLRRFADGLPDDSDDTRLIRVAQRDFEKSIKVPPEYVARAGTHASASYDAWTRARPANDFASMRPFLETTLDLSREYAEFFAPYQSIADPLIDNADEGMTTASIRRLFKQLKQDLLPIVRAIAAQPEIDDGCLQGLFPEAAQLAFNASVLRRLGYDFQRGRLDKTLHPFATKFSAGDVRITTRVDERNIGEALFSTIHEAGHAIYEQGVGPALEGTPLGSGTSAGVHESQSRLWENLVARSRGFWHYFYPELQAAFPDRFNVPVEAFYRAINKVKCSLIRTDADEVTYNLHIMLRFDLELDLLENRLRVKDLPEAWRAAMQNNFGLAPPGDRDGCLQDVHWYSGGIGGAFQSYTIGNILSAQFYAAALKAHPEIPRQIENGEFDTLLAWLREHIYRHGRKYSPEELIRRVTGGPMSTAPYLAYLRDKYGKLYRLPAA
jgi:carboxypeptidase Taq